MSNIQHLAIIMDGNARWAKEKGLPKAEGHKNGVEAAKRLLPLVLKQEIPYLTLYTFSSENWQRSKQEVSFLVRLFNDYLRNEVQNLNKEGIRLKIIGNLHHIDKKTQEYVAKAISVTKDNSKMTLCLAFSYGSRLEIVDACNKILTNQQQSMVSVESFKQYLYDPDMPDVDLLIRSGDVTRISNFLLWQSAYAELYFTKKYWPDFNEADLLEAIKDYQQRNRTFGKRL